MFEDETVDIACPKCGFINTLLVSEAASQPESHIICDKCKVLVKIEAREFQHGLDEVSKELEEMQREADTERKRPGRRSKDDYQI